MFGDQQGGCQAQILACAFSAPSLAQESPQEELQKVAARRGRLSAFSRLGDQLLEPNSQGSEYAALSTYQKTIICLFSFYQRSTCLLQKT